MSAAQEWITDRLPTAADADEDGDVTVKNQPKAEPSAGPYFHWSMVLPGMAWCHTDIWEQDADGTSCIDYSAADLVELIEPAAEPEPVTTPRRFVLIGRTIWLDQGGSQCHIIDAIADDGTAWWMWLDETEWQQLPALPARQDFQ